MVLTLDEIGLKHEIERDSRDRGGDKASSGQDYLSDYDEILGGLRNKELKFLEVGVFQGKSLAVWTTYFTKASVWGIDVDLSRFESKLPELKRAGSFGEGTCPLTTRVVDSTSKTSVENASLPVFDVILDDGLHTGRAQADTFRNLFEKHLAPGGVYIVEDTHANESYSFFKRFADSVSCFDSRDKGEHESSLLGKEKIDEHFKGIKDPVQRLVKSVQFLRRRVIIKRQQW